MNRDLIDMHRGLQLTLLASLLIALIGTLSLAAYGQSVSPGSTTTAAESVLPRNIIVAMSVVNRFFPEVTQEASTGQNLTAVGKPKATRSVIYANSDSSKKVTITVDLYATSSDASSAYQEAVRKSRIVPGFKPVAAPNLGQNAFIGTVTQGTETHIGLGALKSTPVVGATLVGYEPAPETTAKLVSLTAEEEAVAKAALD
jgi:hypothetical protein